MQMPLVLTNRRRRGGSASAPAFSPSTLYSSGSQGIWLDPSDLSTMFSDRAGTTPVTTPGTVVGLRLDKSKGPPGPQLVTNGTFDDGLTGWTTVGTPTVSVASGEISLVSAGAGGSVRATISTVVGKQYYVFGTSKQITSRGIIAVGSTAGGAELLSFSPLVGTITVGGFFIAVGTTTHIHLALRDTAAGVEVKFDNISVRELAGNHAVAPTDAARPTYGVEPKGGRRNLLTWSEDFGNAVWANVAGTVNVTANTTTAPDGTLTADKLVPAAATNWQIKRQNATVVAGTYTFSAYAKEGESGVRLELFASGTGGSRGAVFNLNTGAVVVASALVETSVGALDAYGFRRYSITITATAGAAGLDVRVTEASSVDTQMTGNGVKGIFVWGAQLELGSTATAYQRVTTAYDVTESGVATTHYVQFDGSDDSMSTAAIDFTATDKMSVFAGVRKLSDATRGMVAELSSGVGTTGAWGLNAPNGAVANYAFRNVGSLAGGDAVTASTFAAPISNVLTGIGDIAADVSQLRVNGSVAATSSANLGTGNYANASLFIGRRNNSSLPFNGRDYGLIVVGKAASAGEITDTELWLSDKTAEVDVAKSISPNIYTRSGDTILTRANSIIERRTV